jgi:hypothetical protein
VVFCENALLVVRFAKNVRLEKPKPKYSGFCHKIVPTDQSLASRDPSFAVAVFSCTSRDLSPAVPLDREKLAALEGESEIECTCLELEFMTRQDTHDFQNKYRAMKKEWKDEYDAIELEKILGAEDRGWAPASTA